MGMFDSFIVKCPRCNRDLEFQSKSGPCALEVHRHHCPVEIAVGMDGDVVECEFCQRNWRIRFASLPRILYPNLTRTSMPKDYSGNHNPELPRNKKMIDDLIKEINGDK